MTPRLAQLYLRSRQTAFALACLAAIAALTGLAISRSGNPWLTMLVLAAMPLGAATVVGVGARSPFGEVERTASFPLPALRLGHLAGLTAVAAIALAAMSLCHAGSTDAAWIGGRNVFGYAGLALVGARLLGAGGGGLLPIVYGACGTLLFLWMEPQISNTWWLWPIQAATDRSALAIGLGLLVAGLAIVSPIGARDEPGEAA